MTGATSYLDLPPHPAAALFPPLPDAEMQSMADDIGEHGLLNPITLDHDGASVVDGLTRQRACRLAGFELKASHVMRLGPDVDPYEVVLSANIRRRHLNAEQRRDLVDAVLKAKPQKSDRQVAKATGTSPTTVGKRRGKLVESGDVSNLDTSIDTKGRQQPRSRPRKPTAAKRRGRGRTAVEEATKAAHAAGRPTPSNLPAIYEAAAAGKPVPEPAIDRVPVPRAVRQALAAANDFGPADAELLAEQDAEAQQIVSEFGALIDTLTAAAAELLDVEHPPLRARLRLGQQKTLGEWYAIVAASSARDTIVEALERAQTDIASIIEQLEAA
jgi:hypothetical protein